VSVTSQCSVETDEQIELVLARVFRHDLSYTVCGNFSRLSSMMSLFHSGTTYIPNSGIQISKLEHSEFFRINFRVSDFRPARSNQFDIGPANHPPSPSLPSFPPPLPFPFSSPFPSLPLEVGPLKYSCGAWGSALSSPQRSPSGAPAEPQRSPSGAQAEPQRSPSGAPAEPQRSPSGAPAEPLRSPCGAPAEPQRSPSGASAKPQRSPCGAPAEPQRSPSGASAKPQRSPSGNRI